MNTPNSVTELEAEIAAIRRQLMALGPIHPGSVSLQYQVCGNPACRCMRAQTPERHGPYPKLVYVHRARNVCRFVRADCIEALSPRLAAFKEFRKLIDRWVALSIQIGQLQFFNRPAPSKPRRKTANKPSPGPDRARRA
jgi:hypothetical protein